MTAFDVEQLVLARGRYATARAAADEAEEDWHAAKLRAELRRIEFGDLGSNQETRSRALAQAVEEDLEAQTARRHWHASLRAMYGAEAMLNGQRDIRRQAEFEQRERVMLALGEAQGQGAARTMGLANDD